MCRGLALLLAALASPLPPRFKDHLCSAPAPVRCLRTPTRLLFDLAHLAANARSGLRSGLVLMFIHLFMASLEIIALALGLQWL